MSFILRSTAVEQPRDQSVLRVNGLPYTIATSLIVLVGYLIGSTQMEASNVRGFLYDYHGESYANWDGQWYKSIASTGYFYNPDAQSSVAFFPAYPVLGKIVAEITGLKVDLALLLVANLSFVIATSLLFRLAAERGATTGCPRQSEAGQPWPSG